MGQLTARDLTDSAQNQLVLDLASGTRDDGSAPPGVVAEAAAAARSRQELGTAGPAHLSVVFAMYGETGRMATKAEHPHGEDFVRAKAAQLDWLTEGLPVTWSMTAVDDGCPDQPSSAEMMKGIVAQEGYPAEGHRSVTVLRLADLLGKLDAGPAFAALTTPEQSRKGGSILAGLVSATAARGVSSSPIIACYTDADLSANLAQLGSLAAPILENEKIKAALGQRYGMPGAVLVKEHGPSTEPHSTGDKPDKIIILFRHYVRALLMPHLAHVLDTQAGFKAFDAEALEPVLKEMTSFNETFDVELLIHLAQRYGAEALAVEPIVFTEDFAATNFPSVDPGARHLAMVKQVVEVYERFVAPVAPATGEAADLLAFVNEIDLDRYVKLITSLRAEDPGLETLFDRRWPVPHLREIS